MQINVEGFVLFYCILNAVLYEVQSFSFLSVLWLMKT